MRPPLASGKTLALARVASLALLAGTLIAWIDHWRIRQIFDNSSSVESTAQAIEKGKHCWFFADNAHLVIVWSNLGDTHKLQSLRIASFRIFSPYLIMKIAEEYARQGDELRARFLVDRLAELEANNPLHQSFQRVCERAWQAQQPGPFQCGRAGHALTFKDF